jgi:hypothetical protein
MTQCKNADFCVEEGFFNYTSISSAGFRDVWAIVMDPMATSNPRSATVTTVCSDAVDRLSVGSSAVSMFWDRANRGPMVCLAGYYQGANPYTLFGHSPSSPYWYGPTTEVFRKGAPVRVTAKVTSASTEICAAEFLLLPVSTSRRFPYFADGSGSFNLVKRSAGACMQFETPGSDQLIAPLSIGSPIYPVTSCHLGLCSPSLADGVISWSWNFPAMATDVGMPTAARTFVSKTSAGTKHDVWWRPYTNAVVMSVLASSTSDDAANDYQTRSSRTIDFAEAGWCSGAGCRLYPLRADGYIDNSVCPVVERTSDGGCTGYAPWRAGDGQIFMRSPNR